MVKLPPDRWYQGRRAIGVVTGIAAAFALTACATPSEPRIVVKEVKVPVPVACAAKPPPEQPFSDSNEALRSARDIFEQVKLLLAGRKQRDARISELNAAVAGCG